MTAEPDVTMPSYLHGPTKEPWSTLGLLGDLDQRPSSSSATSVQPWSPPPCHEPSGQPVSSARAPEDLQLNAFNKRRRRVRSRDETRRQQRHKATLGA
jgi:hypothetical protein